MKGACQDYVRIVGRHTKGMRVAGATTEEAWTTLEACFMEDFISTTRAEKSRMDVGAWSCLMRVV